MPQEVFSWHVLMQMPHREQAFVCSSLKPLYALRCSTPQFFRKMYTISVGMCM